MPFQPGVSGNDKGRPSNSGHRQKLFNNLVLPHKEELIARAIEMALEGNESMLKLFLERILPSKPIDNAAPITLTSGDFTQAPILLIAGAEIIKSISNNDITPEEGKKLLDVLSAQRKNIEASVLTERVTEIEFLLNLRQEKKHA